MAEEGPKPNGEIKDSVFTDLFGKDRTARGNFISLYNALHGTSLRPEETELLPETLDRVMYMSYANDVAMQVNGRVVVFIEHQSTINRNMPLRLLSYVARTYERIVPARKKYYRGMVKIPMPEFYVMYNGEDDCPAESSSAGAQCSGSTLSSSDVARETGRAAQERGHGVHTAGHPAGIS